MIIKTEQVKDINGVKMKHGDTVMHKCRITEIYCEGTISHISGGTFAIEVKDKSRALYNIKEIAPFKITKLQKHDN